MTEAGGSPAYVLPRRRHRRAACGHASPPAIMQLQCTHCRTTWHSPESVTNCPACGAPTAAAPMATPVQGDASDVRVATPIVPGGQIQPPPPPPPISEPANHPESVEEPCAHPPPAEHADVLPPRRFPFEIVFFLSVLIVLLAVGVAAVMILALRKPQEQRAYNPWADNTGQFVSQSPAEVDQPIQWRDVEEGGLTLGPARVEIVRAEFGETRGRDASGTVIISDRDYLSIIVRIENYGLQPLHYRSWYGNEFSAAQTKVRVRLWDDADRQYPWILFDDVVSVRWHTPSAEVETGKKIEDVIIFDLPETVDRDGVKSLRLELPAAAVGQKGFYHFELPRSMIEDF